MSESVNPTVTKAQDLFKDLVWDVLVDAELTALFVYVPALKIWPIGPIIKMVAHSFSDKIYSGVRLALDMQTVIFLNNKHYKEFSKATVTLKIIARDKGVDSDEYKNAKRNAKDALASFVHFNG